MQAFVSLARPSIMHMRCLAAGEKMITCMHACAVHVFFIRTNQLASFKLEKYGKNSSHLLHFKRTTGASYELRHQMTRA